MTRYVGVDLHRRRSVIVVLEATWGWYWAADVISEAGKRASGASAGDQGVREPAGENRRGGRRLLADLLRMGMLPESWIAPEDVRPAAKPLN